MRQVFKQSFLGLSLALAVFNLSSPAQAADGDTLKAVQARGHLLCTSGNSNFLGFAEVDDKGNWTGLDIDYCKALTTAIFGSPDKVKLVPISWAQRFPSLQSGDIDVIIKATGWTMSRDTELKLQFSQPYFVGITGFGAKKELGITSAEGLDGGTVCAPGGTSTERLAANYLQGKNIKHELVTFEKVDEMWAAFYAGRCDAVAEWGPNLAASISKAPDPSKYMVLDDTLAMEPESAGMRQGDDHWVDVVNWVLAVTMIAEENGITSKNIDEQKAKPANATVGKLLGVTPGIGTRLGLKDDWAYNVIKTVGNSAEIYERNLGKESVYKLPRGKNSLWSEGGVLYPMVLD
jgi:general L-amino acid transport system substrate-binding protein